MKRLISDLNGVKTYMEVEGETFTIHKVQDVDATLSHNREMQRHNGKTVVDDCYNRVASIPPIFIVKWLQEDGLNVFNPDHADRLKKKLNDSEYSHLRTNEMVL